MSDRSKLTIEAEGVSKAIMTFRAQMLHEAGFDAEAAAALAPSLESKLRSGITAEAQALAREKGVYREQEPPMDDTPDDPGELARRFSRR